MHVGHAGAINECFTSEHAANALTDVEYELVPADETLNIISLKCEPEKANPKMGVGLLEVGTMDCESM
jgi:hypothetical protein